MSAIIPNVTEPPADDIPPKARPTITEAKLGARATGNCHKLTIPNLAPGKTSTFEIVRKKQKLEIEIKITVQEKKD